MSLLEVLANNEINEKYHTKHLNCLKNLYKKMYGADLNDDKKSIHFLTDDKEKVRKYLENADNMKLATRLSYLDSISAFLKKDSEHNYYNNLRNDTRKQIYQDKKVQEKTYQDAELPTIKLLNQKLDAYKKEIAGLIKLNKDEIKNEHRNLIQRYVLLSVVKMAYVPEKIIGTLTFIKTKKEKIPEDNYFNLPGLVLKANGNETKIDDKSFIQIVKKWGKVNYTNHLFIKTNGEQLGEYGFRNMIRDIFGDEKFSMLEVKKYFGF